MKLQFAKGTASDIALLEQFYNEINDALAQGEKNYPGWIKGVYPTRETAAEGVAREELYVARSGDAIAGSLLLSHRPEPAYAQGAWRMALPDSQVWVLYTVAVHPAFSRQGVGQALLSFAQAEGRRQGIRALRLDVFEGNLPAIALYERFGFQPCGVVDLGLGEYGLPRFLLYEKLL